MLDLLETKKYNVCWTHREWRTLWIIQELYRQQEEMFRDRRRRIDDRIISIHQPHARPIKRGKGGGKDTEFGPKINVSVTEGIARVDQINFNAFNEANYLEDQIEGYKTLHGYYPTLVLADQIYWTRSNRNYLKDKDIQMGGVPLGPSKELTKYEKYKARKRNNKRSEVEGKFGQAKSKYGLEDLFTRLPVTIMAEINLIFLALNLIRVNTPPPPPPPPPRPGPPRAPRPPAPPPAPPRPPPPPPPRPPPRPPRRPFLTLFLISFLSAEACW
ncbi:MAG: transposase [Saprospirales bacterium]|nr:transposase [Saprospirales bacterium]